MKYRSILILALVAIIALTLIMAPRRSLADAGFFGGDSDYGGGSSDWGDSSWSSSDGYYVDGGGGGITFGVLILFVIIIIWILAKAKAGKANIGAGTPSLTRSNLNALKEKDPLFSEEAFKEKVANLYMKMQNCWQNKTWGEMRADMTDALFNQMSRQIQQLIDTNRTNIVKNIMVQRVDIIGYSTDDINDIITTFVSTRIIDYTIDDATGKVVGGSETAEKFMVYEWTFVRSKAAITGENKFVDAKKCPSCGAPMDMNHSAKCDYCGSLVIASEYDWALSAIKGISQRTGG